MEVQATLWRQLLIGALVVCFIASIPFLGATLPQSQSSLGVLYTIPVIIAALLFNPLVALGITTLALISHSANSWIEGVAILPWAAQALVLIFVALIGIKWTQRERGRAELVARARRLSEERLQLVEKLTESRLEREQFTGAVMHEIKDLLESVMAFASEMTRRGDVSSEADKRTLEMIANQASHVGRLVSDMQAASQIERGRFSIATTEGDIKKLVSRVVLEQQVLSPNHDLVLSVPDDDVTAVFDRLQMEKVMESLIRNAVNYSPHGGKIEVALAATENLASILVTDYGTGIAQADLPRLFKPYVRLSPSKDTPGLGLGLFVSRAIVEAHGGQFWVESKLGYGSTFHFTLPRKQQGPPQARLSESSPIENSKDNDLAS